jgi:hypothetical protein
MPFDPRDRDMSRDRGQVLYRFRPDQTFDHAGGFIAQVRQYANDDTYAGPPLDREHLIDQAMRLVRWWRSEGRAVPDTNPGSDRAPEFPSDDPLAATHYQIVIPGKVFCRVWPRVIRCTKASCGRVWEAPDWRPGDNWPPPCPTCGNNRGNRQLQFVFAHQCGEIQPLKPPKNCGRGHNAFRLNDRVSRFKDFRWECLTCGISLTVQAFCPNTSACAWTNKLMAPLLHTAGSAYAGQGLSLVNVPVREHARRAGTPGYTVATIGRWLGECSDDEYERLTSAEATTEVPQEVLDSIEAMETSGIPTLTEQAAALRRRFLPADLDDLSLTLEKILGFHPVHDERGHALAASLSAYQRVLDLDRLSLERLERQATTAARRSLYGTYPGVLRSAGINPDTTYLLGEFPVIYLAVGYARAGFSPREADLVPYRGRTARNAPLTTLLYANPTTTEALLFGLDLDRVRRWLYANNLATPAEIADATDLKRWFASCLDAGNGQLPVFPDGATAAEELFGLLHTMAHQLLRALAVDSGYSETSLSEYLFPYELAFALYPNDRSESAIGALRAVLEQNLDAVIHRAVDNDTCMYDPNCMEANRGADHGCLFLPETACRCWNRHLSRHYLYGAPDGSMIGYWDPSL